MVSEESLISCLCDLGCDVPDKSVIDRCVQLCHAYNIDEETFVELWVSYTVSHSINISPTLDDLNKLEEEELKKGQESSIETVSHAISNIEVDIQTDQEITNNVLDIYNTGPSSLLKHVKRARSPTTETGNDTKIRAVDQTFSPSTYSSKTIVPNRAPSTLVRGKVLLNFGPDVHIWKKQNEYDISIAKADNPHVPKDVVYMYEMLSKQGAALASNCESFGERLCHIWNEMGPTEANVRYVRNVISVSQTPFRTWGRISTMIDKSTGTKVVMLEGCKKCKGDNNAPIIRLDLSGIKHYSVFTGQIVAVEGINTAGNVLIAKELFLKGHAPLAATPKLLKDLRVYVAVGPFTPSDNLNYQPLWDLMERVVDEEPNILILIGPFIEYTHSEIKKCTLKDTFQEFFDKILSRVMQCLQGRSTRVVVVSSNRDAHHDPVYPTPEFTIYTNKIGSNTANLCSMPDPCIINVEGLQIGITSVDTLRHLGQQEISNTPGMDRLGRLADHVLSQTTFYPLYPPFSGLNFDTTLWQNYACFEQQPHIIILPSDVRYYCKIVNECLVLNPERLQKYIYAKLCIRPASNGKWDPKNVSCEIAKV
ncbi:DNA polymerase alpha subunit B isoform X1 [Hylaeus anthracinus]|uniref:DNA polymerase alpha subunit B isoform X1 n=1 Tax=Hylaeus anthracinus TaxID=313031 RepID=UPI0023B8CA3E|nr:DNA polymerase alpha subunit B isoform X1 [Hylaeus anthracinus]